MPTIMLCSECGAELSGDSPQGLCSKCLFAAALAPADEGPQVLPQRHKPHFGNYELLQEIARGGMGIVYKARQSGFERIVALKVLSSNFFSETLVRRFQTEVEAIAQLDHPNIVPVYDVGVEAGQQYFTMPYIEGQTLAERLRSCPFAPSEGARLLANISRAIHHAHQRGILHRDLKPANILLDGTGVPFVADFGLAKVADHEISNTRTFSIIGSLSYMSPEQAANGIKHLTTASDVYSLGVILYEILTGHPPFQAETAAATLRQIVEEMPVALRSLRTDTPPAFEAICLRCLEKNPEARFPSALALAEDIEAFLDGKPVSAFQTIAPTFIQSLWEKPDFARHYRDTADAVIPNRRYLFHVMCSFFRRFVGIDKKAQVCDLGCGDGILTEQLLAIDPSIHVTLVDGSQDMLRAAELRLTNVRHRIDFVRAAFDELISKPTLLQRFDFCVSGFAIHHATDAEKRALFRAIFEHLKPGGWFMNIEGVLADDPAYEDWHFELWREWILESEKSCTNSPSLANIPHVSRQDSDNRFTQLSTQLRAVKSAGFERVECHYRDGIYALYTAQMPLSTEKRA